jgi:hypothetical protein
MLGFPKPPPRIFDKRRIAREAANLLRAVYDEVDARDDKQCRCCGRRGNPYAVDPLGRLHHCHILDASLGGEVSAANIFLGCSICHLYVHRKELFVIGTNANHDLEFEVYESAAREIFSHRRLPGHVHIAAAPWGENPVPKCRKR